MSLNIRSMEKFTSGDYELEVYFDNEVNGYFIVITEDMSDFAAIPVTVDQISEIGQMLIRAANGENNDSA